eukprot:182944_1
MGKKAKGKGKGKGKGKKSEKKEGKDSAPKSGDDSSEATKMRKLARTMEKNLVREKKYLNEFQQQESKAETFWTMENKKLDDFKMELRNKLRQKNDLDERQQYELKIYKQKVKHLLHEEQVTVTEVRTESEEALRMTQDQQR